MVALVMIGISPVAWLICSLRLFTSVIVSHFEITATIGTSLPFSSSISFSSTSDGSEANSTTATSALATASRERCTRSLPRVVLSSRPGVSISSDAPTSGNSIALLTGSVVVPATSDTMDTGWPTMAFSSDDLPLLHLPNRATQKRSALGVLFGVGLCILESEITFAIYNLLQSAACNLTHSLGWYLLHLLGYDLLGE